MLCIFMNTEYSAGDLNLFCASLPLQPAEGVVSQKRVEVVGDVYEYKYKYKYKVQYISLKSIPGGA